MILKKEGLEIYNNLIEYLEKNGTCEKVDTFVITELSMYWQIFFHAAKKISDNKDSAVQVYDNKSSNISGWFTAMNQASKNIQSLSLKLGIYEIIKHKLHNYGKMSKGDDEFIK